jgi:dihydrolipoamide dehydrogenase
MNNQAEYEILIIGSGPAGYVAATRAAQVGMKTALVEKDHIGGMCIGWGCIRMKTMLESAKLYSKIKNAGDFGIETSDPSLNWGKIKKRAWDISNTVSKGIQAMLEKYGVDIFKGEASILNDGTVQIGERQITASHILIATGSQPPEANESFKNAPLLNPKTIFEMDALPENIIVFGKGSVAVEMAQFFNLIGKQVTIVNPDGEFLPGFDPYLQNYIYNKLQETGIGFLAGNITKYEHGALFVDDIAVGCDAIIDCRFRNAFLPQTETALELDKYGFIKTNDHFETNIKNVFAIGDVNGKSYLAHTASAQGLSLVNKLKNIKNDFSVSNFPLNLYTVPEIAQIGMTETAIKTEGIDYKVTEYPLSANTKALIEGNSEGFLRILSEKISGHVLGVQIAAEHATDMIAEASAYLQMRGTVYDIAKSIHAHPAISEVFTEAGFKAIDSVINKK